VLFGPLIGAGAQWILGKDRNGVDWAMALAAGIGGSFVGGLLFSLLSDDGIKLRPSGIIGSLVCAVIVTGGLRWWQSRNS